MLISLRTIRGKSSFSSAFKFMIPFSLLIATYSILEKFLLNYFEFWSLFFWNVLGAMLGIIFLLSLKKPRNEFILIIPSVGVKGLFATFIGEGLYVTGALFSLLALSLADASIVSALLGLQPFYLFFYTIILSIFLPRVLQEDITKQVIILKSIAIILMFIGTYLIV